jgi:hypothetical protein
MQVCLRTCRLLSDFPISSTIETMLRLPKHQDALSQAASQACTTRSALALFPPNKIDLHKGRLKPYTPHSYRTSTFYKLVSSCRTTTIYQQKPSLTLPSSSSASLALYQPDPRSQDTCAHHPLQVEEADQRMAVDYCSQAREAVLVDPECEP